jgi:hypothetical protein
LEGGLFFDQTRYSGFENQIKIVKKQDWGVSQGKECPGMVI